jgi:hypothetical protein
LGKKRSKREPFVFCEPVIPVRRAASDLLSKGVSDKSRPKRLSRIISKTAYLQGLKESQQ